MHDPQARRPPHSADLRKHRVSQPLRLYFVTKCLLPGCRFSTLQMDELCAAFQWARQKQLLWLQAFVVMPDHWHALINTGINVALDGIMWRINRRASFPSREREEAVPWQDEFYDHQVRPGRSLVNLIRYIEANPVRRGLVAVAEEWPWSSAHEQWRSCLD
jgi:REP-associated tyrosine transposase